MDWLSHPIFGTDAIFHRACGQVDDRSGYVRILTPDNPCFYWGNCLIFKGPPAAEDVARWEALFKSEIETVQPESAHRAFGWLGGAGASELFEPLGLMAYRSYAMTCSRLVRPDPGNDEMVVRAIESDAQWLQVVELHVRCRDEVHEEAAYRTFKTRQFAQYRRMQANGLGARFGGYLRGQLCAELGVYVAAVQGDERLGRYNNVCTDPSARRQGLAAQLVYEAGICAQTRWGVTTLVIVTDEPGPQRVYRRAGFELSGACAWGMDRPPLRD